MKFREYHPWQIKMYGNKIEWGKNKGLMAVYFKRKPVLPN
jgi:hypothetical protein